MSSMPDFFDIHSHLNFPDYDADREEVITRLKEKKTWTITVGTDKHTSKEAVLLCGMYDGLFATVGLHPGDNTKERFNESDYVDLISHPKVVAVGECGLDYGRSNDVDVEERQRQKRDFEAQIDFAVAHEKPIMIHCRNAHEDILDILESRKKEYGDRLKGNAHFFSGSKSIAGRYLDLNFTLSFTGVITFTNDYNETLEYVPLTHIMSETDAPYVTPVPHRPLRNEPIFVEEVVKRMAKVKKLEYFEVKKAVVNNALERFCIRISQLH
jgi:TatD DNase family protein